MNGQKTSIGSRLARMANANAFRWLLCALFIVLFSWPYVSFVGAVTIEVALLYFFTVWMLLIAVLKLLSIADTYVEDMKNNG